MSALATREARAPAPERDRADTPAPRLFGSSGPTLEDAIVAILDELTVAGRATCPVCSAEMTGGGRCEGCGSELG